MVERAGIKDFGFTENGNSLRFDKLRDALIWLRDFYLFWREANRVWLLCEPAIWDKYKMREETELLEVKMLEERFEKMRKAATKRPILFRKSRIERIIKRGDIEYVTIEHKETTHRPSKRTHKKNQLV